HRRPRDVGIAGRVHRYGVALVHQDATQAGGVDQRGALSVQLGYKGVYPAARSRLERSRRRGEGTRWPPIRGARDVGVAVRVHGDAIALVRRAAAQIRGVDERALPIQLHHEGVTPAASVSRLEGPCCSRELGKQASLTGHVSIAGRIYGNVVADVNAIAVALAEVNEIAAQ